MTETPSAYCIFLMLRVASWRGRSRHAEPPWIIYLPWALQPHGDADVSWHLDTVENASQLGNHRYSQAHNGIQPAGMCCALIDSCTHTCYWRLRCIPCTTEVKTKSWCIMGVCLLCCFVRIILTVVVCLLAPQWLHLRSVSACRGPLGYYPPVKSFPKINLFNKTVIKTRFWTHASLISRPLQPNGLTLKC